MTIGAIGTIGAVGLVGGLLVGSILSSPTDTEFEFGALTESGQGHIAVPAGATALADAGGTNLTVVSGFLVAASDGVSAGPIRFNDPASTEWLITTRANAASVGGPQADVRAAILRMRDLPEAANNYAVLLRPQDYPQNTLPDGTIPSWAASGFWNGTSIAASGKTCLISCHAGEEYQARFTTGEGRSIFNAGGFRFYGIACYKSRADLDAGDDSWLPAGDAFIDSEWDTCWWGSEALTPAQLAEPPKTLNSDPDYYALAQGPSLAGDIKMRNCSCSFVSSIATLDITAGVDIDGLTALYIWADGVRMSGNDTDANDLSWEGLRRIRRVTIDRSLGYYNEVFPEGGGQAPHTDAFQLVGGMVTDLWIYNVITVPGDERGTGMSGMFNDGTLVRFRYENSLQSPDNITHGISASNPRDIMVSSATIFGVDGTGSIVLGGSSSYDENFAIIQNSLVTGVFNNTGDEDTVYRREVNTSYAVPESGFAGSWDKSGLAEGRLADAEGVGAYAAYGAVEEGALRDGLAPLTVRSAPATPGTLEFSVAPVEPALNGAAIDHFNLYLRPAGTDATGWILISPYVSGAVVPVSQGDYEYRVSVVDVNGKEGFPSILQTVTVAGTGAAAIVEAAPKPFPGAFGNTATTSFTAAAGSNRMVGLKAKVFNSAADLTTLSAHMGSQPFEKVVEHLYTPNNDLAAIFVIREADIPAGSQTITITNDAGTAVAITGHIFTLENVHQTNAIVSESTASNSDDIAIAADGSVVLGFCYDSETSDSIAWAVGLTDFGPEYTNAQATEKSLVGFAEGVNTAASPLACAFNGATQRHAMLLAVFEPA
ncbi:hypothetical protein IWQ49_006475 [Labrenzia sp. EL_126]|nr:hypothetical protein [Labrenzia sp. EL_126]